jgi:hypothetical protein
MKLIIALFFSFFTLQITAQQSVIRGTITEDATGEPLPGVTVFVEGTTIGAMSDFDGEFSIPIAPGLYDLRVSFISYETINIKGLKVEPGKVSLLDNLKMKEANFELAEVVVTAAAVRNTEAALMTVKAKAANMLDGISSSNFRKIGDSDAASSIKRVPGVSVEGGKYVFVRGLGDRYTKTILNGMDIPGLDPDRNTLQMDIFPTNIIDNIIVYKTFAAELPADFTGGIIDIATKDFPEQRTSSISLGAGYNPDMHLNKDFLTYEGGATDWLGFDDGTRKIPATEDIPQYTEVFLNPNSEQAMRYKEILSSFNPVLAASNKQNFIDYNLGYSLGNQINRPKASWGYSLNLSYKSETEFYKDADFGRVGIYPQKDSTRFERREYNVGNLGISNVMVNGMLGLAYKTKTSKIRLNLLRLQNGESTAGVFDYEGSDKGSNFVAFQQILEYNERSMTNALLSGKHVFAGNSWEIEWKVSPTLSRIYDPDIRFTRYEIRGENSWRIGTETGFPERIWRELNEYNLNGQLGLTHNFNVLGRKAKLLAGSGYTFKERDFIVRNFNLNIRNVPLTGDMNELFFPENLWPLNGDRNKGTTYEAPFLPDNSNKFDADMTNIAGYASVELSPFARMRSIIGIRVEDFLLRYSGQNQQGEVFNNEEVLDQFDFFPTVNLIYSITEKQNLRLAYAKTIARPSFKEMSYAEIFDPISGKIFVGGLFEDKDNISGVVYWDGKLQTTDIHNLDLRWEMFQDQGQMFSVSGFYKKFYKPIEIVQFVQMVNAFQPRNVGDGRVFGVEIEARKNLNFINPYLSYLTFVTNLSVISSRIEMTDSEFASRQLWARDGETVDNYREMAGQAPYLVNAGFLFEGVENGFFKDTELALFYNVQGPTLQIVGIVDRPDIYSLPFHSLNFNASKKFGKSKRAQIGIKIDNLLNQSKKSVFRAHNTQDEYDEFLNPGIKIQLRFQYNIF